jgi:hypothetical protein
MRVKLDSSGSLQRGSPPREHAPTRGCDDSRHHAHPCIYQGLRSIALEEYAHSRVKTSTWLQHGLRDIGKDDEGIWVWSRQPE